MKRIDRLSRLGLFLLAGAVWSAALPDAASGQDCVPPQQTAKGHLELRHGELRLSHELDTAGIRNIVNRAQGYVAGSWHVPLGLTFAEFDTRFETSFRYRKAQPYGYCVALSEAKVSIGYDLITIYVSRDYPEGSCEYETILAHEREHVRINRDALRGFKPKFQEAFARLLRSKKVLFVRRKEEARSAYLLALRRQFDGVVADMLSARNLKNGTIDTQDNYRRLMARCRGWRTSALSAAGSNGRATGEAAAPGALVAAEASDRAGEPAGQVAQAATPEPGTAGDPPEVEFVRQGRGLTAANARQLEKALKSLPYDFPTRARLLGFYFQKGLAVFGPAATVEARRRHILWLIENHPGSPVAALPEAMIDPAGHGLADLSGYERAKALWLAQAEAHAGREAVRQNAKAFLLRHDKAAADALP